MEKLNAVAMESIYTGSFGKVPNLIDVIKYNAEMLRKCGADKADMTLSFSDKEIDLQPEIIIRVRRPKEES